MTSRSMSEKPKDTSEFKDRTRERMTYTTSQWTSGGQVFGHPPMRDQAGVGSRPPQAIEWASEERHDRQLNAPNRTRFAAEVVVLKVPLRLVRFESHNTHTGETARTFRICTANSVFGARQLRQEAVLDVVELDVQSGRVQ